MTYEYQNKIIEYILNGLNEYQNQICKIHFLVMNINMYGMEIISNKYCFICFVFHPFNRLFRKETMESIWIHIIWLQKIVSWFGTWYSFLRLRIFFLMIFHICIRSVWLDRKTNQSQQHIAFPTFNIRLMAPNAFLQQYELKSCEYIHRRL